MVSSASIGIGLAQDDPGSEEWTPGPRSSTKSSNTAATHAPFILPIPEQQRWQQRREWRMHVERCPNAQEIDTTLKIDSSDVPLLLLYYY